MRKPDRFAVSATFAFGGAEGNVGVPLESQLVLSSLAHANSAPINLAQVRITFEGGFKNISIHHKPSEHDSKEPVSHLVQHHQISLQNPSLDSENSPTSASSALSHALSASAELTLAPGGIIVISLMSVPRDAGEVHASSMTMYMKEEDFDLELVFSEDEELRTDSFWFSDTSGLVQRPLKAKRSNAVRILPKPPKMRISLPNVLGMYYVNEDAILGLQITNEEEEHTKGSLEVRLLGPPGMHANLTWRSESDFKQPLEENILEGTVEDGLHKLPTRDISVMEPGAQQKHWIRIQSATEAAEYSLQVEVHYCLLSDPETPISKIFNTDLIFMQPFEATFSFAPRVHPDPWPNYFDVEDTEKGQHNENGSSTSGLIQCWSLTSRLTSLAADNLVIEVVSPKMDHMTPPGTATCHISSAASASSLTASPEPSSKEALSIEPGALQVHTHTLDIRKMDLEDRHSLSLDLILEIQYRRPSEPSLLTATKITLRIPPLPLPFGEPRCLASFRPSEPPKDPPTPRFISLIYTIENPSMYTLTFALSMDNNEAFAFSGPKSLSIQLLPMSRRAIEYRILPVVASSRRMQKEGIDGRWIWPHFVVVDTGFRKTLRILPAAEGLKGGRTGEIGVWLGG